MVMRGTKKFLDRAGRPSPSEVTPSGVLGRTADAMVWRPQVALFVNERSLFPVLLVGSCQVDGQAASGSVAETAEHVGIDTSRLDAEMREMDELEQQTLAEVSSRGSTTRSISSSCRCG